MMFRRLRSALFIMCSLSMLLVAPASFAAEKTKFRIAWSIYVGWMPYGYGAEQGIFKKWGDKYGIEIEVVQINDYIESINQYTAGAFDACSMTNMDALTIPAAGGVDSTALIVGDFSNGNDALVLKDTDKISDMVGMNVNLVELSVSHYLLARALESADLAERDLKVVNTSDADIVAAFNSPDVTAAVFWNPQLAEALKVPGATKVFDSADIAGEIIDMLVVNTETLAANPDLGKALVGAWYEIMAMMAGEDDAGAAAREAMGMAAGTDLAGYEAQLATTKMFYEAADAVSFTNSPDLLETMDNVRKFSFDHGLLGDNAPDVDVIGIEFAGGEVLGDNANIKLRFNPEYMQMAADGSL